MDKEVIQKAIKNFTQTNLTENAVHLFKSLGYNTSRSNPLPQKTFDYFKSAFPLPETFNAEKAGASEWKYFDILFQLSNTEIAGQSELWDNKQVDNKLIESYLFALIELTKNEYSRSFLARICREVNKIFPMPVLVLFRYGEYITISVIDRRINKRRGDKDVLEHVTLIKDISIDNPHRAHIEILFDFSFNELTAKYPVTNFVELHDAWQKILDTKELNKRFYRSLVEWYGKCFAEIKINLTAASRILNKKIDDELKPQAVIRVIIRLMFMWFMQEKKLLPKNLFTRETAKEFLKEEDTFYNAVLQNLFFAVLNKKIDERRFRKQDRSSFYDPLTNDYGVCDVFRYKNFFKNGKADAFVSITQAIPFVNGGLFVCHDYKFSGHDTVSNKRNVEQNYIIDGFSDNPKDRAFISDSVIFGLIDLFNSYKFTIEESTPADQEIALDPELLGTVFENLIGFYNPETKESARKATGSFYTPREIVDYMCKESLKEALASKLPDLREQIADLIESSEDRLDFPQKNTVAAAITGLKILDPACGSGAFPMGMFNLMVKTVEKLQERKTTYKNKLDIITNCIYGVDIQNIAIEITKLRFFISLLVDYNVPVKIEDFEVLPNLETKFTAANTLIGINLKGSDTDKTLLFTNELFIKCKELTNIFTPFTTAKTPKEKERIKNAFETKKQDLVKLLADNNMAGSEIEKVSAWNPFNVCYTSPFFDSEIMFGIAEGFDVVIGNPPYGAEYPNDQKNYFKAYYESAKTIPHKQKGSLDTFTLFIEKGHILCKLNGNLHFIVPIAITSSDSMSGLHRLLENTCEKIQVSSYAVRPQPVFQNAVVNTSILFFTRTNSVCNRILATKMHRKSNQFNLQYLVSHLEFVDVKDVKLIGRYPKISLKIEKQILRKLFALKTTIADMILDGGTPIFYRTTGGRYFKVITNYATGSNKEKPVYFDKKYASAIGAILSSNLFFWFYQIYSNNLDLKAYELESFRLPLEKFDTTVITKLEKIYAEYLIDIEKNANIRHTTQYANIDSFKEYKIGKSKYLIDKIDDVICPLYGLTKEETEFIKNYEIEFRVGED